MPKAGITEATFERKAIAYLQTRGFFIKIPRTRFTRAGVSDLIGVFNGRFIAIELKRPGRSNYGVTALQEAFMRKVRDAGGIAGVARSIEDLEAILKEAL